MKKPGFAICQQAAFIPSFRGACGCIAGKPGMAAIFADMRRQSGKEMPRSARHFPNLEPLTNHCEEPFLALPWVMKPTCTMPASFASCITFQMML